MAIKNNCTDCNLFKYRKNMVLGYGKANPDFLFFGEAPGKDEDEDGIPFIGSSGKLLRTMIETASKDLHIEVFFINAVICRPTDDYYGNNRSPTPTEVFHCQPKVDEIIKRVNPRNIIYVGDVSYKYYHLLFPSKYRLQHPAYILRKGGLCSPEYITNLYKLNRIFRGIE